MLKEEYKRFDWRTSYPYGSEEEKQVRLLRESEEFKQLLLKALTYKIPKHKFVITKMYGEQKVFARVCPTCTKWERTTDKASKFLFEEEAKNHIYTNYKDVWRVEQI